MDGRYRKVKVGSAIRHDSVWQIVGVLLCVSPHEYFQSEREHYCPRKYIVTMMFYNLIPCIANVIREIIGVHPGRARPACAVVCDPDFITYPECQLWIICVVFIIIIIYPRFRAHASHHFQRICGDKICDHQHNP